MTRCPPTHSIATVPTTPITRNTRGMALTIRRPTLSTGPGRFSIGSAAAPSGAPARASRSPKSSIFTSSATSP